MKKVRDSNYELLRIVSMFFIIFYHALVHGHVIDNAANEGIRITAQFIEFFLIIHVNSFVLVTGYYQSKAKFKASKIWFLITSSLFYKILIMVILSLLGIICLTKVEILRESFFLNLNQYWFIQCYLFLYCLSPFINKLIASLDKRNYLKLLLVLFVIMSIIPFISGNEVFDNNGYTLYNFVFLYLIGGYLRKYPIQQSYLFKRCSKQLFQIICVMLFFFCLIANFSFYLTSSHLSSVNSVFGEIFSNFRDMALCYSNPFILLQSIAFFAFFGTLDIKSSVINKLSSLTLGIYLIHENNFIRSHVYQWLRIDQGAVTSYQFLLYVLLMSVVLFFACALIEWLRQVLFRFIANRKVSLRIRQKYHQWVSNIKILKDG